MSELFAQLRRNADSNLTETQAMVQAFIIIAVLMFLGFIALKSLDYFRDRVKKFQPLIDPIHHSHIAIKDTAVATFIFSVIAAYILNISWAVAIFIALALLSIAIDRFTRARQQRVIADLCSELAFAVRARLPLDQFFFTLSDEYNKTSLKQVGTHLQWGAPLSAALEESKLLPAHIILAIRSAEAAGGRALESILLNACEQLRKKRQFSARLFDAVYAPLVGWAIAFILGCITFGIASGKLLELTMHYGTPHGSQQYISKVYTLLQVISWDLAAVLGAVLLIAKSSDILNSPKSDQTLALYAARLPLIGAELRHGALYHAADALSAMTANAVPLPSALKLVSDPGLSGLYAREFLRMGDELHSGVPAETVFRSSSLPDPFKSLLIAGAAGGTLSEAFATAAAWHEQQTTKLDKYFFTLMPCILVPFAATLVGLLYGSVFMLLTDLRESVMTGLRLVH